MSKTWIDHRNFGEFFVEEVLIDCGFPLLFVCKNSINNERYLSLCIEDGERYILAKCKLSVLIDLLYRFVDVRSVFEISDEILKVTYENNEISIKSIKFAEVDEDELPLKGVLLETDIDVQKYIEKINDGN